MKFILSGKNHTSGKGLSREECQKIAEKLDEWKEKTTTANTEIGLKVALNLLPDMLKPALQKFDPNTQIILKICNDDQDLALAYCHVSIQPPLITFAEKPANPRIPATMPNPNIKFMIDDKSLKTHVSEITDPPQGNSGRQKITASPTPQEIEWINSPSYDQGSRGNAR